MRLKNISVSESNYQKLRGLGHTGQSFNDVISELLARVLTTGPQFDGAKKQWSEQRPLNRMKEITCFLMSTILQ